MGKHRTPPIEETFSRIATVISNEPYDFSNPEQPKYTEMTIEISNGIGEGLARIVNQELEELAIMEMIFIETPVNKTEYMLTITPNENYTLSPEYIFKNGESKTQARLMEAMEKFKEGLPEIIKQIEKKLNPKKKKSKHRKGFRIHHNHHTFH